MICCRGLEAIRQPLKSFPKISGLTDRIIALTSTLDLWCLRISFEVNMLITGALARGTAQPTLHTTCCQGKQISNIKKRGKYHLIWQLLNFFTLLAFFWSTFHTTCCLKRQRLLSKKEKLRNHWQVKLLTVKFWQANYWQVKPTAGGCGE